MIKVQTILPVLDPQLLPLPNLSSVHHHLIFTPSLLIPACPSDLRCGFAVSLRMLLQQLWKSAFLLLPASLVSVWTTTTNCLQDHASIFSGSPLRSGPFVPSRQILRESCLVPQTSSVCLLIAFPNATTCISLSYRILSAMGASLP